MPRPRSEKARRSVLVAMRRAITVEGYDAVTIEGLAAEAEVSKQTIYRWWPSKAAILGEALLEGSLPGIADPVPTSSDLTADLRAWLAAVSDGLARPEGVALARALIAVTATDPALGDALNERLAGPIVAWIVERIERARAAGEVRDDVDAEALADQFVALASYEALRGRPLGADRVDATVRIAMWGIAAA
ncbi:AcrR family transcriptional regulator [Microbacterium resistens]|uniref:AcrR family transcriptional regulator n=1 Tax=Microbacterium resistens TaxID=156977 RepID=A0ABU1SC45_9MICO|nr:TetR/AcrR family transcriptional regulator [Microbacterium resistens]MDR6867124.1 AcrR family transcriptional regulator [Microbacterium resistens]